MSKTKTTNDKPGLAGAIPKGQENKFQAASAVPAEWGRLPSARGRCTYSGLSRSALVDLSLHVKGLVVRVKKPGSIRGACLLHLPTLQGYLSGLRSQQTQTQEGER
jgi:hypothetical protein